MINYESVPLTLVKCSHNCDGKETGKETVRRFFITVYCRQTQLGVRSVQGHAGESKQKKKLCCCFNMSGSEP